MHFLATIVFLQCSLGGVKIPKVEYYIGGSSIHAITKKIDTRTDDMKIAHCKEININIVEGE